MKTTLTTLCAALAMTLAARCAPARPNIVFLYCDDLRWDTIGTVQREQGAAARFPWLRTPRLDELASQGVRFRESFVVTSLCSPGRAGVMTSRYGHFNGVINNSTALPPENRTIARQLHESGYTTAYCGKWHMGSQRDRPDYDFTASFVGQGRYNDCPLLVNGVETPTKGWVDDVTTDYAIQFLEKQPRDKPFFLWLGFKSPHGPRGGANLPERVKSLYADDKSRSTPNTTISAVYKQKDNGAGRRNAESSQAHEGHRDFMRHATAMDACAGRLLDALKRTGRDENTLVIFSSDNGFYLGEHGLGDKRSAYDESLRVPLLVRLPGKDAARGTVCDAMVLNLDYGPTILDFAGAPALPEAQGRSLRPLLEGKKPGDWRTAFCYEYFQEPNFPQPTVLALRTTTHKLVTYPGHEDWTEVFDLKGDPYEITNQVSNSELLSQLKVRLDEQAKAVGFRWPQGYGTQGEAPDGGKARKSKKNRTK